MNWTHICGIFALASLMVTATLLSTPTLRDFSPENPYWNGLLLLKQALEKRGYETIVARQPLNSYPKGAGIALIIVAPETAFSREEIDYLKKHVALGGLLIILDDFAYANQILEELNAPVRIVGKPLLDPVVNLGHEALPVATIVDPVYFSLRDLSLVLNLPSALEIRESREWFIRIVATTSEYSFVDYNGNGKVDEGENGKPLPIAVALARREYRGFVIVASDASLLVNSMLERGANKEFLLSVLERHGIRAVIVDDYHHHRSMAERIKTALSVARKQILLVLSDPLGKYFFILLLVLGLLMSASRVLKG